MNTKKETIGKLEALKSYLEEKIDYNGNLTERYFKEGFEAQNREDQISALIHGNTTIGMCRAYTDAIEEIIALIIDLRGDLK